MQIVIDIPNWLYNAIMEYKEPRYSKSLGDAVRDGTPLPKGHGKLIDVGQCDRKLFYQQCGGADSLITVESAFDMLMSLPAIIEADKAEREG